MCPGNVRLYRLSVNPAPIPSRTMPRIFHQPTPIRSAPSRPQRSIAAPAANWPASSTETVAITPIREPATVIASTMMMLISAPLQSQTGSRAAAVNSPKRCRATSISAIARSAASEVAHASAPRTPTRSPSFDITATCTDPATPARIANSTTRTFTAGQHRRPSGHEEGRRGPALFAVWLVLVLLPGRDLRAVDGRVLTEHLHLGDVHFVRPDAGVAVGVVVRVEVLVSVVRGLARALVVRDHELDVRGDLVARDVEVPQRQVGSHGPRVDRRERVGRGRDDLRPARVDRPVAGRIRRVLARPAGVGVERAERGEPVVARYQLRGDAEPLDHVAVGVDVAEADHEPAADGVQIGRAHV